MLKQVRRAIADGALTRSGCCVAETFHLLEEALRSRSTVEAVLAAASARAAVEPLLGRLPAPPLTVLPDRLFRGLAATETSQGVIALVRPPQWTMPQLLSGCPLVVVLDGLQDPGNAGAIARTAEAFGATGLLFLQGAVSPFNPKTLRASAGSLFRLPFLHAVEPAAALDALTAARIQLYAAVPARPAAPAAALDAVDLARPCAFVIGSEARGVRHQLRSAAVDVSIPTAGVESLNASVAAGILLYEARRRRNAR